MSRTMRFLGRLVTPKSSILFLSYKEQKIELGLSSLEYFIIWFFEVLDCLVQSIDC